MISWKGIARMEEFIRSRKGFFDIQHSTIKVELGSSADAEEFLSLFASFPYHWLYFSLRLGWCAPRTFLYDFFLRLGKTNVGILEVDGVTLDNLPQDHVNFDRDIFQSQ